ncbi:hypothetical protein JQR88_25505 (plasmid) [Pseudomonas luteola]|uniref:hypothetical protein n=1 Tax=Pseudomonas luteola TaxID=47886 RepID=UPI003DA13145
MRFSLVLIIAGLTAACANQSQSTHPLDDQAYVAALEKQREAVRAVRVYKEVPTDALGVRPVMAAACGSNATMTAADEDYILTGLKLKAYSLSSDSLAEVDIQQLPSEGTHCEGSVPIGGTAKAFTMRH